MSLIQASDTEDMQVKINSSDKQSKNGDEQIEGMSVSDLPEFKDPAILVVRESVKIRYTREELIKLKDAPLSKKKPDFFDVSVVSTIFDPDRWSFERKKSDTPTENGPRAVDLPEHRRRSGDPRERIRIEYDGIVLSPQRRSFNSGCLVPVMAAARSNRSHSPLGGKGDPSHIGKNAGGVREIQSGTRRIGSGRILRDSWDFGEKSDAGETEYGFRGTQQRGDDKYERRSFGRDFEMSREREGGSKDGGKRNGRYDRRRISENRELEEPEWFSGGPISQTDTIELRGFDESEKPNGKKKLSPSRVKRAKEWSKKKTDTTQAAAGPGEKEAEQAGGGAGGGAGDPTGRSTPGPQGAEQPSQEPQQQQTKSGETTEGGKSASMSDQSFNLDDILKCDSIPGLLPNGVGGDGDNMKSRFSRWFKVQESPERQPQQAESRRSSMHDDHHIIKDLLSDIGETSVSIPGDSEAYFAPISPAGGGGGGGVIGGKRAAQAAQPLNIMEMLQKGKQAPQMAGKILSLDELEAKMRRNTEASVGLQAQKHQKQKPDEEMTAAFKKLLAQAQAAGPAVANGPMNKTQPMSLLEMLSHSQQQDEAARLSGSAHMLGVNAGVAGLHQQHHHQQQHHLPNELSLKLQQAQFQQQQKQQMEMLNKLINATVHPQQMRTSPLHDIGMQQSRELLSRPEAQAILQGLKRGEITTQHLYQQLANPALQPRHREMLVTILKMQGGGASAAGYGPSPRVLSPVPPHHMFQQQQQQQLRVSPLPPNAMHQRIPSPRELQVHTQNILQRALIKKKLEEQQENYRKKQEMQRGQSPSAAAVQGAAKSVASPTPLAFTPTSVLRKMTADKDDGKENKGAAPAAGDAKAAPQGRAVTGMRPQPAQTQGQQWSQQFGAVKQPGRPIVKANSNYQGQAGPEQFFAQQQQRMFGQSQQPQQQRKPTAGQFGGGSQAPNGHPGGGPPTAYNPQYSTNQQFAQQQLTQQQLRAQHQHRPANQPMQSQQSHHQQSLGFQQQHQGSQQQMGAAWQQFFSSAQANRNANPLGRGGVSDGDLSPTTTNQLARWFSPDLLERARGGELPSTAGLAQHALSLEEIERQTAPPVHN